MRNSKKSLSRILALLMIATMGLTGCGGKSEMDRMKEGEYVKPGETVSSDSMWINSAISGSVDETVNVSYKDDFYTAVNKDWDIANQVSEGDFDIDEFQNNVKLVTSRKLDIISGKDTSIDMSIWTTDKNASLTEDIIVHDMELVTRFAELAGNWDRRNSNGVEPIRKYVEEVMEIDSMDAMTDFIEDPSNIVANQMPLVSMEVTTYPDDVDNYHVIVGAGYPELTLSRPADYYNIDKEGQDLVDATRERVTYLLTRLGYSHSMIKSILYNNYKFECKLASKLYSPSYKENKKYRVMFDKDYTLDDIKAMQGDYPLTTLMQNRGLDVARTYKVYNENQIRNVASIYKKSNLEQLKSYFIVHFLVKNMDLLDRETYDRNQKIIKDYNLDFAKTDEQLLPMPSEAENTDSMTEEEKEIALLFNNYINTYLGEPMEAVYIAKYTTPRMKEDLIELINKIKSTYKIMLASNNNRDADFIARATKKLDNMGVRVLYPDKFTDFSELEFSDAEDYTLLEAVASIEQFNLNKDIDKIGKAVDRSSWDLSEMPTTAVAAYNKLPDNSINICEGILATDFMYSLDHEDEVNMGRLGMVVAHEISHAFDQNGLRFDELGHQYANLDLAGTFNESKHIVEISRYCGSVVPYPGASYYDGSRVTNEMLADMGGVKCMLMLALDDPDFDYDLFFKSYAQLWRQQTIFPAIWEISQSDVHPLNFMRTNMVVQQYDKFLETYDVQPGDGMYLDPKNRVVYW